MKYDKFFALAKEAGIEEVELSFSTSHELSFSLFHGEIVSYTSSNSSSYLVRGLYKGKLGTFTSDVYNSKLAKLFVDKIIENASVIENDDPVFIFKGSEKYKKINTFNKELGQIPVEKKIEAAKELEAKIRSGDKRIVEVQTVAYAEEMSSRTILNSHGLKLTQKNNFFYIYGAAVGREGNQTKSGYDIFFNNDFSKLDIDKLAKSCVAETVDQLGGEPCESATYKAVLSPDVVSALLNAYVSSASAEDVQKNSSLFIGKLGQKVASNKVTVEDLPLAKTVFARSFDDEGVATYNKPIIKNGVLQTYLYNLTTAAKDGVQTTANGESGGASMVGTSPWFLRMKPGKKSQDELFKDVNNGVYITDVSGLHAGLNPRSGNFSLQSTGYLIENGKRGRGLDIITVSGNLVDLFNSIEEVGSDSKVFSSATECPSVVIKKIAVSGK